MAVIISLTSGHVFDEIAADTVSAELLNKMFENGFALVDNLPISIGDGGTGAQTTAAAQKALSVSSYLQGWVEVADTTITIGTLPVNSYVHAIHLHVTELFNDTGTDQIRLGTSGDDDEFFTLTDVSTTGVKSPVFGVSEGYNSTTKTVVAEYVGQNTDGTTGKAMVILEYMQVDIEP